MTLVITSTHICIKNWKIKSNANQVHQINLPESNNNVINIAPINNNRYNNEVIGTFAWVCGGLLSLIFLATWISRYIAGFWSISIILVHNLGPNTFGTFAIPLYLYVKKKELRKFIYETVIDLF